MARRPSKLLSTRLTTVACFHLMNATFTSCKILRQCDVYSIILITAGLYVVGSSCVFPPTWQGAWFEGDSGDVIIGQSNISRTGTCVHAERGYYLMDNACDLFVL